MQRLIAVGRADDVPRGEGRAVSVAGRRIAVFHTDDSFRAVDAACPHRCGPLADGLVGGGRVICPLHGWRIDLLTGEVVAGGEGRVAAYEVVEREGWLYLAVEGLV